MSEMLGNQYFLARDYYRASEELQKALRSDPRNKSIRRKLIICYTQLGNINEAVKAFLSLIKEDIDFIINTDPVADDCPCPELIFDMENKLKNNKHSKDFHLILGMLWLYCNLQKSFDYFITVQKIDPHNTTIKAILTLLRIRITGAGQMPV